MRNSCLDPQPLIIHALKEAVFTEVRGVPSLSYGIFSVKKTRKRGATRGPRSPRTWFQCCVSSRPCWKALRFLLKQLWIIGLEGHFPWSCRPSTCDFPQLRVHRGNGHFRGVKVLRCCPGIKRECHQGKAEKKPKSIGKRWRNLDPGQSRTPLAWPLVSLVAMTLWEMGEKVAALCVLTMFTTYGRPNEILKLQKEDLAKSTKLGVSWALNLNTSEEMFTSKIGLADESILSDSPVMSYLGPALERLAQGVPTLPLFRLDYARLLQLWKWNPTMQCYINWGTLELHGTVSSVSEQLKTQR